MVTPQTQQQPAGSPQNPGIALEMISKAKTPSCASRAGSHPLKPSLVAAEGAELGLGGFSQTQADCEGGRMEGCWGKGLEFCHDHWMHSHCRQVFHFTFKSRNSLC